MTDEQRAKNIRVETEIMGRARTSAVRTPSGDLMTVGQCPRDFCNDLNLIYEMEMRLEEMDCHGAYLSDLFQSGGGYVTHGDEWWALRHPVGALRSPAEFCVDAALRALDSVKAGAA